jgi:16S rRNA (guanine1516-N2)-methyltransferase
MFFIIAMASLSTMDMNNKIAILAVDEQLLKKAQGLSLRLNLPLIPPNGDTRDFKFLLTLTPLQLELHENSLKRTKPIFVDFLSPQIDYRIKHGGGKNQLIAKALGIKNQKNTTIIDATAGLGIDAFVMASLGCNVTMVERSPIIAALLLDGLERLKEKNANLSLNLVTIEAKEYLAKLSKKNSEKPNVIYLDPMYPSRVKTALNKKSMRILHEIVGEDKDAADLLEPAINCAKDRVVVKRPKIAGYLGNKKPDVQYFSGKSTRFDVYFPKCN